MSTYTHPVPLAMPEVTRHAVWFAVVCTVAFQGSPRVASAASPSPAKTTEDAKGRSGRGLSAVGAPRFELGTSSPPDWRANQAAPRPVAAI